METQIVITQKLVKNREPNELLFRIMGVLGLILLGLLVISAPSDLAILGVIALFILAVAWMCYPEKKEHHHHVGWGQFDVGKVYQVININVSEDGQEDFFFTEVSDCKLIHSPPVIGIPIQCQTSKKRKRY